MSIASVVRDEKKPDQQLIEGETKLTEDTSSEGLGKSHTKVIIFSFLVGLIKKKE